MKTRSVKIFLLSTFTVSILLFNTGCFRTVASVAGAAGGALVGKEVKDDPLGIAAGAAIGLIAAQQAADIWEEQNQAKMVEAYEQGKREARVEAANEFWNEVTYADGSHPEFQHKDGPDRNPYSIAPTTVNGVNIGAIYGESN